MSAARYYAVNLIAGAVVGVCLHGGWKYAVGLLAVAAIMLNVAAGID